MKQKIESFIKWSITGAIIVLGLFAFFSIESCSATYPKTVLRIDADEIIIEDFPMGTNTHYLKSDGKVYRVWGVDRNKTDSVYYVKSHLNYQQYEKEKIYYVPHYSE